MRGAIPPLTLTSAWFGAYLSNRDSFNFYLYIWPMFLWFWLNETVFFAFHYILSSYQCFPVNGFSAFVLMMDAARTSETLVNFYQTTRRYNPVDSHLRLFRCFKHLSELHLILLLLVLVLFSSSLITGFFLFLVLFLFNQWWTPPLRLQVSDCSTLTSLCVIFLVRLPFVENLLNAFLILFPDIFLVLKLQFLWPQWSPAWQDISYYTFAKFLCLDFVF
jgi:hypothetical protein